MTMTGSVGTRTSDTSGSLLPGMAGKRVVTIGGGTGPFALLAHLKRYPCKVTAIVSMADSGGSSRRLMDEFGQLPFGDLRQALVALSRQGLLWRQIFGFRFGNGQSTVADLGGQVAKRASDGAGTEPSGVGGHSLGNLIISALQELNEGNLLWAIDDAQELLVTAGRVLPVTLSHATLCAKLTTGDVICGETEIDTRGIKHPGPLAPIESVFLDPEAEACADAIRAIERADLIIIGPGDLYTSVLPNLLVRGVSEAIRAAEAEKVYVCNLMTKRGETDGFRASDFVREIVRYLGNRLDRVVLHDGRLPLPLLEMYASEGQHPVVADVDSMPHLASNVIVDNLLMVHPDHLLRHDADRLIRAIFERRGDMLAPAREVSIGARARHTQ